MKKKLINYQLNDTFISEFVGFQLVLFVSDLQIYQVSVLCTWIIFSFSVENLGLVNMGSLN